MATGTAAVDSLLKLLDAAITDEDCGAFCQLFAPDGWYRDLLVTTWQFHTVPASGLSIFFGRYGLPKIHKLSLDPAQQVEKTGLPLEGRKDVFGAYLVFNVGHVGTGRGYMRAVETLGGLRIFSLFFGLQSLLSHPDGVGSRRPLGTVHSSDHRRSGWLDSRAEQEKFEGDEPTVVIVGAGHSGLMLAARLTVAGISCLVLEKSDRIGDSWRKRYSTLCTHVPSWGDHFPMLPYPSNWPLFTPKDKLANWYEFYAQAMELNVWTSCTVLPGTAYDSDTHSWSIPVMKTDGMKRILHPRHVVQATGHSGEPRVPIFAGLGDFKGDWMHSSGFHDGKPWAGRRAVIVGCCNSAHDIAQSLYESGAAAVTMVQRSSTLVTSSAAVAEYYFKPLYAENGPHFEDADIASTGTPIPLLAKIWEGLEPAINDMDADIRKGLTEAGFNVNKSPTGLYWLYYTRGGGYYIDVGCSHLIADKKISIKQGVEISRFIPDGLEFEDGSTINADLVVLATGWDTMNTTCEKVFGHEIAKKTSEVWGLDGEGELKSMWRSSGHSGFWFMGGSFQLARVFSRYLALQIMATEDGLMPREGVMGY